MYKLDLPIDQKEAAAIERRRNQELERQNRIFNAKVRTVGVDVQGLQEQIHDRNLQEQRDRERDEAYGKMCSDSQYNRKFILTRTKNKIMHSGWAVMAVHLK